MVFPFKESVFVFYSPRTVLLAETGAFLRKLHTFRVVGTLVDLNDTIGRRNYPMRTAQLKVDIYLWPLK